jgi:hypothetical protein
MAPIHEHSTSNSDPILPCCAPYLGKDLTSQHFGGFDGIPQHNAALIVAINNRTESFEARRLAEQARRRAARKAEKERKRLAKEQKKKLSDLAVEFVGTADSPTQKSERARGNKSTKVKRARETVTTAKFPQINARTEKSPRFAAPGPKQKQRSDTEDGISGPSKAAQGYDPNSNNTAIKPATNKASQKNRLKTGQNSEARRGGFSDNGYSGPDPNGLERKSKPNSSTRKALISTISPQAKPIVENWPQAHKDERSPSDGCSMCPMAMDNQTSESAMVQFTKSPSMNKSNHFGSITLQDRRHVQVCGFSDEFARHLGREIAKYGGRGVEKERKWGLGYEFKLIGDPWGQFKSVALGGLAEQQIGRVIGDLGTSREEKFLRHMFRMMHLKGYSLHLASQQFWDIGTFYFEKSMGPPRSPLEVITVSFHNPNRLRLTCAPQTLIQAVEKLVEEKARKFRGERRKTQNPKKGEDPAVEYRISGLSWTTWHVWFRLAPEKRLKVTKGRAFKLDLMLVLKIQGWKPILCLDRGLRSSSAGDEHVGNSWYFSREQSPASGKKTGLAGTILQRVVGEHKTVSEIGFST